MDNRKIQAEKKALRERMLKRRLALAPGKAAEFSRRICRRLGELSFLREARAVFATYPVKNEVDLLPLMSSALDRGQKVVMPFSTEDGLRLCHLASTQGPFENDHLGIPAPAQPRAANEAEIDLLLLPGLAFDSRGHRLGYGRGLLDGLGQRLSKIRRIGVCYACQFLPCVPFDHGDVAVHAVVTEDGFHETGKSDVGSRKPDI